MALPCQRTRKHESPDTAYLKARRFEGERTQKHEPSAATQTLKPGYAALLLVRKLRAGPRYHPIAGHH
jgi:hypothetical protein